MSKWITKRLDEVSTVTMGQSPPSSSYNTERVGVPFLQGTPPVIDSMGTALPNQWTSEPTKVVEAGTALITVRAPVGELFTTNNSVCLGRGLAGVKANSDVSQNYLNYYLQYSKKQFSSVSQGSTFTAINSSALKNLEILLPHIDKQNKIGNILHSIDREISKTTQIIQKTENLRKGLLNDLYTKGIDHSKFKKTKVGMVPTEWKTCLLDDVAKRGTGHTPSKKFPNYWNGGIKWVSLSDTYRLDHVYISETEKEISQDGIDHSSAVLHPAGVVVLSRDAGVGKSAITTEPMAVSQHFIAWECGDSLNNLYLYYLLQYWKPIFENIATGSTIKTIGMPFFKNLEIPLPSVDEQKEIAQILFSVDQKIAKEKLCKDRLLVLKNGLMRDIFSQKVHIQV